MNKSDFDSSLLAEFTAQDTLIAGVDEVGRGALFGSVVAAAVVLPLWAIPQLIALGVKDSKKLSPVKRQKLIQPIQNLVTSWQISFATVAEIDKLNILQASLLAMRRSVLNLPVTPDICLIDGNFPIPNLSMTQKTVIKGDLRSPVIAAASILAKVWRDELITDLAYYYPEYDLACNKGYPTARHLLAIAQQGITPEHRRSFKSCQ
ncbi:ribonuclease HII [Pleurocapsa sp. CCALA 161]|uniref:ribonuclease HII n=1 Tax=Pleurocapsa sp. CCALA 161 TaxID=2107688 RepID=UPI000D07C6DC|nr:ribonuclease HII [Pleurocapsa sp. CCALA 161]PSB12278.1 ribonuclease HII [Pleurocapsa sp. CCALA 161]